MSSIVYTTVTLTVEGHYRQPAMKDFFQSIDVFDKSTNDEFRLSTKTSSVLSYILAFFGISLLLLQVFSVLRPSLVRDLNLQPQGLDEQELVNVSLDVVVNMPCYFLHLDVIDSLGSEQLDINTTAKFMRLSKNGRFIGIAQESLSSTCHSCHGLQPEGFCCNSCEQMILLLLMNGSSVNRNELSQCAGKADTNAYIDEKCRIKGKISLNKAQGNFHIAPGSNMKRMGGGHMHNLNAQFQNFDLSHSIAGMRVGPKIPLTYNPLNRHREMQYPNEAIVYRYSLIVTPALYKVGGKIVGKGYDYTALVNKWYAQAGGGAPGVFFHYSFTPYGITVTANYLSPGQMITSTFGFLAGVYALLTIFDESFFKDPVGEAKPEKESQKKSETTNAQTNKK